MSYWPAENPQATPRPKAELDQNNQEINDLLKADHKKLWEIVMNQLWKDWLILASNNSLEGLASQLTEITGEWSEIIVNNEAINNAIFDFNKLRAWDVVKLTADNWKAELTITRGEETFILPVDVDGFYIQHSPYDEAYDDFEDWKTLPSIPWVRQSKASALNLWSKATLFNEWRSYDDVTPNYTDFWSDADLSSSNESNESITKVWWEAQEFSETTSYKPLKWSEIVDGIYYGFKMDKWERIIDLDNLSEEQKQDIIKVDLIQNFVTETLTDLSNALFSKLSVESDIDEKKLMNEQKRVIKLIWEVYNHEWWLDAAIKHANTVIDEIQNIEDEYEWFFTSIGLDYVDDDIFTILKHFFKHWEFSDAEKVKKADLNNDIIPYLKKSKIEALSLLRADWVYASWNSNYVKEQALPFAIHEIHKKYTWRSDKEVYIEALNNPSNIWQLPPKARKTINEIHNEVKTSFDSPERIANLNKMYEENGDELRAKYEKKDWATFDKEAFRELMEKESIKAATQIWVVSILAEDDDEIWDFTNFIWDIEWVGWFDLADSTKQWIKWFSNLAISLAWGAVLTWMWGALLAGTMVWRAAAAISSSWRLWSATMTSVSWLSTYWFSTAIQSWIDARDWAHMWENFNENLSLEDALLFWLAPWVWSLARSMVVWRYWESVLRMPIWKISKALAAEISAYVWTWIGVRVLVWWEELTSWSTLWAAALEWAMIWLSSKLGVKVKGVTERLKSSVKMSSSPKNISIDDMMEVFAKHAKEVWEMKWIRWQKITFDSKTNQFYINWKEATAEKAFKNLQGWNKEKLRILAPILKPGDTVTLMNAKWKAVEHVVKSVDWTNVKTEAVKNQSWSKAEQNKDSSQNSWKESSKNTPAEKIISEEESVKVFSEYVKNWGIAKNKAWEQIIYRDWIFYIWGTKVKPEHAFLNMHVSDKIQIVWQNLKVWDKVTLIGKKWQKVEYTINWVKDWKIEYIEWTPKAASSSKKEEPEAKAQQKERPNEAPKSAPLEEMTERLTKAIIEESAELWINLSKLSKKVDKDILKIIERTKPWDNLLPLENWGSYTRLNDGWASTGKWFKVDWLDEPVSAKELLKMVDDSVRISMSLERLAAKWKTVFIDWKPYKVKLDDAWEPFVKESKKLSEVFENMSLKDLKKTFEHNFQENMAKLRAKLSKVSEKINNWEKLTDSDKASLEEVGKLMKIINKLEILKLDWFWNRLDWVTTNPLNSITQSPKNIAEYVKHINNDFRNISNVEWWINKTKAIAEAVSTVVFWKENRVSNFTSSLAWSTWFAAIDVLMTDKSKEASWLGLWSDVWVWTLIWMRSQWLQLWYQYYFELDEY